MQMQLHSAPKWLFGKRKIEANGGFLLATYGLLNITPQK
jgi:hypothetical protein